MRRRRISVISFMLLISVLLTLSGCGDDNPVRSNQVSGPVEWGLETASPNLWAVAGTTADDIWAVGDHGEILHYDGVSWEQQETVLDGNFNFRSITVAGDHVFAGAYGFRIGHFDGDSWTGQYLSELSNVNALWAADSANVYGVTDFGTVLHFDGALWTEDSTGVSAQLKDVWGSAANDVFAVGGNGTILHFDGLDWEPMATGFTGLLTGVTGTAADDVYAVTSLGAVLHYDGYEWSEPGPQAGLAMAEIVVTPSGELYGVAHVGTLLAYAGNAWSTVSEPLRGGSTHDACALPDGSIFWVGDRGIIGQYVSRSVTDHSIGLGVDLTDVFVVSDNLTLIVAEQDSLLQYVNGVITPFSPQPNMLLIRDVFAFGPDEIYIAGQGSQWFDGTSWHPLAPPINSISAIFGVSQTELYAVGANGYATRFCRESEENLNPPTSQHLRGVWSERHGEVFVVGDGGMFLHYDTSGWDTIPVTGEPALESVWGKDAGCVYAVEKSYQDDRVYRWDGSRTTQMWTPYLSVSLTDCWGTSADDVYICGFYGKLVHFDGETWSGGYTDAYPNHLNAIHGGRFTDVFAVGTRGTIMHGRRQ